MATLVDSEEYRRSMELGDRVRVIVEGQTHEGEVVRCGNTRTWGHMISDVDGQRYEFQVGEEGFEALW